MTRFAHITGWGMAIPEKILTNQELSKIVDTNHDWIVSRTGIHERRIVSDGESTATLAREAALKALEIANLKPADVDLIIVSTSSPEHIFPATACLVQDEIGATKAGAFDLSAACTGFIYALEMATQAIRGGSISNAIVIGSETLSRFVNWKDRGTCILFGDGAGAFVLQGSDEPGGLISTIMRSDGSGKDLLSLPAGGSKLPASKDTIGNGLHYIQMSGREVFRFATKVMAQATLDALDKAQMSLEDIDLIIPHQANYRIIDMAARNLNFPMERVFINVDHYGNTSTASIPIATCEAIQKGRLNPGDKVVFVGFGAGLTWGAAVAQWSKPFPFERRVYPARYRILARIRSLLLRIVRRIEGWIWGKSG
jgi:3-oxoacyl-[acyl-carrier-protein] synthase-3